MSQRTRPDICFATHKCASFSTRDPKWTIKVGKQILRYLVGTKRVGLRYTTRKGLASVVDELTSNVDLVVYAAPYEVNSMIGSSDASFAPENNNTKSVGAFVVFYAGGVVFWKTFKQTIAAEST